MGFFWEKSEAEIKNQICFLHNTYVFPKIALENIKAYPSNQFYTSYVWKASNQIYTSNM